MTLVSLKKKGPRFEHITALALLQACQFSNDYLGIDKELFYIRTKDQREVDFAIALNNKMSQLIECKYQDDSLSKQLKYFSNKYSVQGVQLVKELKEEYRVDSCEIKRADSFLKTTFWAD